MSSLNGVVSSEDTLRVYVHFRAFSHCFDVTIAIAQSLKITIIIQ